MATAGEHLTAYILLYKQDAPDLRRYVRTQLKTIKHGNCIDAEDIVQEAFLRVWSTDNPNDIKNINGYLFRTAKNLITDIGRRRASRPIDQYRRSDDAHVLAAAPNKLTPERFVCAKQDLDMALRTIDKLPDKCRKIFRMQRETGETYATVARSLNISESTVQKQMARALLALRMAVPAIRQSRTQRLLHGKKHS